MDNILYYPYINLPPTDWTIRTLLYYKTIGTIVPRPYLSGNRYYDPFMRNLVEEGLVVPISPTSSLRNPLEVNRQFIKYMESSEFKLKKRVDNFKVKRSGRIHRGKFENDLSQIHSEKFEHELFYQLENAGLAKKGPKGWYDIESRTANELMTFIATVLGINLNYLPTTDQLKKRPFKSVGVKKKDYKVFKTQTNKRELILQNLIPFPQNLDLKKLVAFKGKNSRLLTQFKNRVEEIVLDSSLEPESEAFENKIEVLKDAKEELSARMNESRLVPKLINAAGIIASVGGLQSDNELGVIAGAIGLAGVIAQAVTIEKPRNKVDQTGLKYLVLAERTLVSAEPNFIY
jgi:hypothetical protein